MRRINSLLGSGRSLFEAADFPSAGSEIAPIL